MITNFVLIKRLNSIYLIFIMIKVQKTFVRCIHIESVSNNQNNIEIRKYNNNCARINKLNTKII